MQLIARPWSVLQAVAVLAALVVLALLLFAPRLGLFVTWYVLIPLVPVLLLAAPGIWRNLCPVAVLSQLPALSGVRPARRFPLRSRWGATIGAGILFLAIVPLRPAIFNQDALALFLFTLSVVVASIAGGLLFPGKAGWCSSVCPVLPVERLYGQLPIIDVEHAHCSACDGCMTACYDLKPVDSLRTLTRAHTRSWELVRTPLGLFGAAFPGFILGYFVLPGDASISETYLHVITWSCASILMHAVVDQTLVRNRLLVLRVAAATAAALYYWFTIPAIATAARELLDAAVPAWFVSAGRLALVGSVALWFFLSMKRLPPVPDAQRRLSTAFD